MESLHAIEHLVSCISTRYIWLYDQEPPQQGLVTEFEMKRMHNPPHPGEVLREYLGEVTVTSAALQLGVSRGTLQRIVSGAAGVSPDMAFRLAAAFGTSPDLWVGMQLQHDLHRASKMPRPNIKRIAA
jgi:addiction module HigA family antidote